MSTARTPRLDAVEIQVFRHLLASIPEEMGGVLMRSAFSPNIKERLDFSCALTDRVGEMAAQASHIPVHLGSVHVTAACLLEELELAEGDVIVLNDPFRGGTHLPDVTLFAPVFLRGVKGPAMGVLARAHHADVGGATPGSMGLALDLHGEGVVVPPVRLVRDGELVQDVFDLLMANTRTPDERAGDLRAQLSAVDLGRRRVEELAGSHGARRLLAAVDQLKQHAGRATRAMLRGLADGEYAAEGALDGSGTPVIRVRCVKRGGRLSVDFSGTDDEIPGSFNANPAITASAVFYVMRLLVPGDLPTNSGCLRPVRITIPEGCFLRPRRPAGVAMGNVETSQRLVDVLLQALAPAAPDRMPACSQGTMNNVSVGGRREDGTPWTFYETLGGGVGAGPGGPGESGLGVHMTNTMNTPVEALEAAFPVRVRTYRLRRGSGGAGRHAGGEGLVREFEALEPMLITVVASRRRTGAPGLAGGGAGSPARDRILVGGRWRTLEPGETRVLQPGERLRIETPGGGGWGTGPE